MSDDELLVEIRPERVEPSSSTSKLPGNSQQNAVPRNRISYKEILFDFIDGKAKKLASKLHIPGRGRPNNTQPAQDFSKPLLMKPKCFRKEQHTTLEHDTIKVKEGKYFKDFIPSSDSKPDPRLLRIKKHLSRNNHNQCIAKPRLKQNVRKNRKSGVASESAKDKLRTTKMNNHLSKIRQESGESSSRVLNHHLASSSSFSLNEQLSRQAAQSTESRVFIIEENGSESESDRNLETINLDSESETEENPPKVIIEPQSETDDELDALNIEKLVQKAKSFKRKRRKNFEEDMEMKWKLKLKGSGINTAVLEQVESYDEILSKYLSAREKYLNRDKEIVREGRRKQILPSKNDQQILIQFEDGRKKKKKKKYQKKTEKNSITPPPEPQKRSENRKCYGGLAKSQPELKTIEGNLSKNQSDSDKITKLVNVGNNTTYFITEIDEADLGFLDSNIVDLKVEPEDVLTSNENHQENFESDLFLDANFMNV